MRRLTFLLAFLVATPAMAAHVDAYVLSTGNDSLCDGTHNASCASVCGGSCPGSCTGTDNDCARATISSARTIQACDLTITVGSGTFIQPGGLNLATASGTTCTSTTPVIIDGGGPASTTFLPFYVSELTGCSETAPSSNVWSCAVPSGGDTSLTQGECLLQKLDAPVDFNMKTGEAKATASGYLCLTPTPDQFCDADGLGPGDTTITRNVALTNDNCQGMYTVSGSNYLVHLWNNEEPGSGSTQLWAHSNQTGNAGVSWRNTGTNLGGDRTTVKDMTIISGTGRAWEIIPGSTNPTCVGGTSGSTIANNNGIVCSGAGITTCTTNGGACTGTDAADNTVENVVTYGSAPRNVGSSSSNTNQTWYGPTRSVITDVHHYNAVTRVPGIGCGLLSNPCRSSTSPANFVTNSTDIGGDGTIIDGYETYLGSDGIAMRGRNGTFKKIKIHSFTNHALQLHEILMNATFENLAVWNGQEGISMVNCQRDILFKHITIEGSVQLQTQHSSAASSPCPDDGTGRLYGQWDVSFQNSVFSKLAFFCQTSPVAGQNGDVRDGARGFVDTNNAAFDRNGEFYAHNPCTTLRSFPSVTSWRTYSGFTGPAGSDTCSDCSRDLGSAGFTDTGANIFENTGCNGGTCSGDCVVNSYNDLDQCTTSLVPRSTSALINAGSLSYAPSDNEDIDGNPRVGNPDIGAWEYISGGASCGNNTREGAEVCDGTDLAGETCATQGHDGGALACNGGCTAFDDALCTDADATDPDAVSTLVASNCSTTTCDLDWTTTGNDGASGSFLGAGSIDIRWAVGTIVESGAAGAQVNWADANQSTGEDLPLAVTAQDHTVIGLPDGTTIYFALKVTDPAGNESAISNVDSETTVDIDTTDPDPVSDLAIGTPTSTSCPVTWTDTGDDGASGAFPAGSTVLLRYRKDSIGGIDTAAEFGQGILFANSISARAAGTQQSVTLISLEPSTAYDVAVVLRDEAGNPATLADADLSNIATCTTSASPPAITNPETITGATCEGCSMP
jgi:hypothetical protein